MANYELFFPTGIGYKKKVPSAFIDGVDTQLTKVPNFAQGSDHTTSAQVILRGEGLYVVDKFQADDAQITITTGKSLITDAGSATQFSGTVGFLDGCIAGFVAGSALNMLADSTATVSAGAILYVNGRIILGTAVQIEVDPVRTYTRATATLTYISTAKWSYGIPGQTYTFPLVATQAAFILPGAPGDMVHYALEAPHGAVVEAIRVAVKGGFDPHLPTDKPKVRFVKKNVTTGADEVVIGLQEDDSVDGAAYITLHTITLSGLSETIDRDNFVYTIVVEGEGPAGGQLGLEINAPRTSFARSYVGEE